MNPQSIFLLGVFIGILWGFFITMLVNYSREKTNDNKYCMYARCSNCDKIHKYRFEKGKTLKEQNRQECPNCRTNVGIIVLRNY